MNIEQQMKPENYIFRKIHLKVGKKLIPLGMQVPPVPVDDYAAIVIGRKYLKDNK